MNQIKSNLIVTITYSIGIFIIPNGNSFKETRDKVEQFNKK